MRDELLRDRPPAAVVAVAAVAVPAVAVPVVELVLLRLQHALDLVVHHPRDVVTRSSAVQRREEPKQVAHRELTAWTPEPSTALAPRRRAGKRPAPRDSPASARTCA